MHLATAPLRAVIKPGLTALQRLDLVGKGKQRSLLDGQRWFSHGEYLQNVIKRYAVYGG